MLRLTLDTPPSANRYWRSVRGRIVRSKDATDYKSLAGWQARTQGVREPLVGNLVVSIHWYRGRRSGDLDNRLKVVLDTLEGICYQDDKQIIELHAYRYDDKQNPRIEVEICQSA